MIHPLNHHPGSYQKAQWLKQLLELTKLPFPCQYEILCLTATHSPTARCLLQHRSQKAIRPREGSADMTAVLQEEKKRGHWLNIEQALGIFCCPQTTVLLLRDTEWDEGISGEPGQAEVLWKEYKKKMWWKDEVIPRGQRFKLLEGS